MVNEQWMMAFWISTIVVLADMMEYVPAAIIFVSVFINIRIDYFTPLKIALISYLVLMRYKINFSKVHLPEP